MALESDLEIVPVINKIDLPSASTDEVAAELAELLGISVHDVLLVSAKTGAGVESLLNAIVHRLPAPSVESTGLTRALVFDSHYDSYKGVVSYIRMVSGRITSGDSLCLVAGAVKFEPLEIGVFAPQMQPTGALEAGQVGYVTTGLKTVQHCRVGDTLVLAADSPVSALPGYRAVKPMVYGGFYPVDGEHYGYLKSALEKLQLNDAALVYQAETSQALGFGFRCGFLGLFHMEIVQERLEREYELDIIATAPSVEYEVLLTDGQLLRIESPSDLPEVVNITEIREPWMRIHVYAPELYYGTIMELATSRRGVAMEQEHYPGGRVVLSFRIPLSELIVDFYDWLKSRTRGYASLDYQFDRYQAEDLVRLQILVNQQPVDALATIVHRDSAYQKGQKLITKLKELIPRQLFPVAIQAAAGGRVISRANVKALRKDVLAKCYGGDVTRKKKLLARQKKGRKRLKMVGNVEIPQQAFMAVLQLGE
jgi:GTP-binding protein LepA